MQIKGKEFHHIIKKIFGDVRNYVTSEQIQVNCPKCQERAGLNVPDGKFNLEINTAKGMFRCWKCSPNFSGSLGKLIRIYGTSDNIDEFKEYGSFVFTDDSYDTEEVIKQILLPKEFVKLVDIDTTNPSHMEAYYYATQDRKIPYEFIEKYNIGFCASGRYKNRLILPSYDFEGKLNYFISRAIHKKMKPPYLNPKLAEKQKILFNEYYVDWDRTIILVEGVFDAISLNICGLNAVPLLGKTLSNAFFDRVIERDLDIIIVFDPDAMKNAIEVLQTLTNIYYDRLDKVRIVELPDDSDDIDKIRIEGGKKEILKYLYSAREINNKDYLLHNKFHNYKNVDRLYTKW